MITEHAIDQFRLASSISTQGWLIQTARSLTAGQINSADSAFGLTMIEERLRG